jgi:GT2 family glycosyltransferase
MKITLGIILFTGCEKYMPFTLKSLLSQDSQNLEILLRDQSPNGEVKTWIEKNMPEVIADPRVKLSVGPNLMHSGGHNALIREMTGNVYVVASNDMLYPPNFVSKIEAELSKPENAVYASFSPKLMRWNFEKNEQTNFIDSCGIGLKITHHFYDLGQGEQDQGQYDTQKEVFGPSGALSIFKKEALEAIKYQNEYYDELLHYKNDCDMAYRLQWAGFKTRLLPSLKVWHDRQVSGQNGILESRSEKSKFAKESSFFGHLVVLKKNFDVRFSFKIQLATALYNLAKFVYIAVKERFLLEQYKKVKTLMPQILAKRSAMKIAAAPQDIETLMT